MTAQVSFWGPMDPMVDRGLSNASKLKLKAQEQLVEMCMNRTLQLKYNQMNIDNFWLTARQEYPEISQQALSQIKTKSRFQLKYVENELRVCLTSISPRIETICAQKQAHVLY